ncbi:MAG: heparinase II/III family protein [Kiritimatiellia bacterium]
MRPPRLVLIAAAFAAQLAAANPAHPRVYFTRDEVPALRAKAERVDWARKIVQGWHKEVDPLVAAHVANPTNVIGRFHMHWEEGKRYTRFYAAHNRIDRREGNARYPTVMLLETRPGQEHEKVNGWYLATAYHAAILYHLEGDRRYLGYAHDLAWFIVRAGAQHEPVNPDEVGGNMGFLSYETLGDTRHYWAPALVYDLTYEAWSPAERETFRVFARKFIDNKLTRGGGLLGNWNLNEHQSAMLYALALDGEDRRRYVTALVRGPTTDRHGAYVDVLRANVDAATGLWPEAPGGYGQGSIAQLVKFGFIYWKNGIDLLSRDPLLQKASVASLQLVFPNGYITNIGDSSYHRIWSDQLELMLAYAKAKGDAATVRRTASVLNQLGDRNPRDDLAFCFYEAEVPQTDGTALRRYDYAPIYPVVLSRNFSPDGDPKKDLAFSLAGLNPKMGHGHPNGLTMELYGCGEVLGPDIGSGGDYWQAETHEYYRQVFAHNTVVVNGSPMHEKTGMMFETLEEQHTEADRQRVKVTSTYPGHGFAAKQERELGIVRRGGHGYVTDSFRSEGELCDYFYHNVGVGVRLAEAQGLERLRPVDGASLGAHKGYGYFTVQEGWRATGDRPSAKVVFDYGRNGITLAANLRLEPGDEVYLLLGPRAFRHYDPKFRQLAEPAFMLRRRGGAWARPFRVVYEPRM